MEAFKTEYIDLMISKAPDLFVALLVNFVLDVQEPSQNQFICSDINNDNALNVVDIILLVIIILDEI